MRTKNTLINLQNISTLLQYLYMSQEHSIIFNNGIADLKLQMNENLGIKCQNLNFPDLPPTNWSSNMTPENCYNIVEILKETPSVEFPNHFKNRWEEIATITKTNLSLNIK